MGEVAPNLWVRASNGRGGALHPFKGQKVCVFFGLLCGWVCVLKECDKICAKGHHSLRLGEGKSQ